MYVLNIANAIKKDGNKTKPEALSFKTIINELDFLKKTVIIQ